MNFQFYLEKITANEEFQKFKKENPSAFPCSCYFVVDKENEKNPNDQQHVDYFIPENKKMVSFKIESDCERVNVNPIGDKIPEKISLNYDFDFSEVQKKIEEKMKEEGIKNKIQKLIYSLQRLKGKDYLVGTIFISGLGILKIHYDISEKKITHFEKKTFMEMLNIFKKKPSKKEEKEENSQTNQDK